MVYQTRNIISESERNRILNLYNRNSNNQNYIFEACITIDGRYLILKDDVFDIVNQSVIGNIWESLDTFKNIFSNLQIEGEEFHEIKENILSLPILESNQSLKELKNILLEFNFMQDTWLGREISKSGKAIGDSISRGLEGLKKFGVAISSGNWSEILSALAKGVRFVLRELKDALYSNLGAIVDAILIATGIGKGFQMLAWALVLALDIYQFTTNDYPAEEKGNSTLLKLLDIGFDILGLVTTGYFAISARKLFAPLRRGVKATDFFAKNPNALKYLQTINNSLSKVGSTLKGATNTIAKKFPAGAQFINKSISGLDGIIKSLSTAIGGILPKVSGTSKVVKGSTAGTVTGGIAYGIDKFATKNAVQLSPIQIQNTQSLERVLKSYGNKDPFD